MDDLYPRTLDLKIFRDDLGGQLTSDSMLLDVLSQFSDEYKFLKAIGAILPSLIEFYQWLHTDLAYMVTVAKAGTVTIQEVVLRATRGYSNELKQHYIELHEKVQGNGLVCMYMFKSLTFHAVGYNEFVEVSSTVRFGGCGSPNTIEPISKETSLLHFLSDKEEEGEGNDCLFVVIDDMVRQLHTVRSQFHTVPNFHSSCSCSFCIHRLSDTMNSSPLSAILCMTVRDMNSSNGIFLRSCNFCTQQQ